MKAEASLRGRRKLFVVMNEVEKDSSSCGFFLAIYMFLR